MTSSKDLLEYLIKDECYFEHGHFRLVSGKHSDSYIQVRIAMMNPDIRKIFSTEMVHLIADFKPTIIAANTIGGIPLAIDTAKRLGVDVLVGRMTEGSVIWVNAKNLNPKSLERVIYIDDVLTTSGTITSAIQSIKELGATIIAVAVVVDRSLGKERGWADEVHFKLLSLLQLPLNIWDPSDCPICPKRITNLHNPEQNLIPVILSMPPKKAEMIFNGYEEVYKLQEDEGRLKTIAQWRPWLQSLLAGLPVVRVGEDSELAEFISLLQQEEPDPKRKRVLTEIIGHLLACSNIRVEARSLGCSLLIGDGENLLNTLEAKVPIRVPTNIKSDNLDDLIPYYDALSENEAVFLFDREGDLVGIKRLVRSGYDSGETRGIQLLRQVTKETDSLGFVLSRKRQAISVYRKGRLETMAELSEKTGIWEFTTTIPIVKEIGNILPDIDEATLEMVLEISREMVNRGYGGLFVIGEVPPTLQRKPPKIKMESVSIGSLGVGIGAEIAKLDGAMFLSEKGEIKDASVIISNNIIEDNLLSDSSISAASKVSGARRETARLTSLECPKAAVVCVSQNGTIDIFIQGISRHVSQAISGVSGN
jgi:orotate phosphoribosyltransferase